MKFRANRVGKWIDKKTWDSIEDYIEQTGADQYEITIYPDTGYISNRLRNYLMSLVRLIYEYRRDEIGEEDITIRKVLHEIEEILHPEFDLDIRITGVPMGKWKSKPALMIKERLQVIAAQKYGLYLPDPNE